MRTFSFVAVLLTAAFTTVGQTQEVRNGIIRLDPAIDGVVSADAKAEPVASGFKQLEGPLWVRKGRYLIFSDLQLNKIIKWNPEDGKTSTFLDQPSTTATLGQETVTGSNGLTQDPQGRLVYCSRGDHSVVRVEPDGRHTILASEYGGQPLLPPNDLIYRSDGTLYFTTPSRSHAAVPNDGRVYVLKDGKLQIAAASDPNVSLRHNGLALSPDEKYLYTADNTSDTVRKIARYDVKSDGALANGRTLIDMSGEKGSGAPDGIKVDKKGNIYGKGPSELGSAIWIVSPAGKHIGTFVAPSAFTNLAFGDADGKTLYVVGGSEVHKIRLKVEGIRP
jgi:gluconolactonase